MPIFSYNNNIFSYNNKVFQTPWNPGRLSNMIFWSDASNKNINQSNGRIHMWRDNSGNLNNAIQIIDIRKPSVVDNIKNGYPALFFQGSQCLNIPLYLNYYTTFTVVSALNNNYIYEFSNDATTNTGFYLNGNTNAIKTTFSGSTLLTTSKNYTSNWLTSGNSWKIIVHQYDGTHYGHRLIINKSIALLSNVSTNNPGNLNKLDNLNLGSRYNGSYGLFGYITEFMVFNDYLDLNTIYKISDWLNNKYSIY